MATLSFPSIIILLQLLFLTTGDLITAAPVQDICQQTKNSSRCSFILAEFDTATAEAELPELAEIVIRVAGIGAGQVKRGVNDLISSEKDPNVRRNYENCGNLYNGVVDAMESSREYLKERNYGQIVEAVGIVGGVVEFCAPALVNHEWSEDDLEAGVIRNADVGVLAQAVGLIAKKLLLLLRICPTYTLV